MWVYDRALGASYCHVSFIRSSGNRFFGKPHAFAWERTWYIYSLVQFFTLPFEHTFLGTVLCFNKPVLLQ